MKKDEFPYTLEERFNAHVEEISTLHFTPPFAFTLCGVKFQEPKSGSAVHKMLAVMNYFSTTNITVSCLLHVFEFHFRSMGAVRDIIDLLQACGEEALVSGVFEPEDCGISILTLEAWSEYPGCSHLRDASIEEMVWVRQYIEDGVLDPDIPWVKKAIEIDAASKTCAVAH